MVCCTDNATAKQCLAQELINLTPWSDRSINTCSAHGLTWLWTILMAVGICSLARWAVVCAKQPHNAQFTRASDLHLHEANMLQSKCGMCSPQVDLVAMPEGPDNPHGNGFWARETPLLTESKAMRVADPAAARAWKISNPASTHPVTGRKDGGAVPRHVKGTRSGWQANLL
jgi:Copper amine oxidase, enzyme domain